MTMEISATLKNDIKDIQGELTKAIRDHQNLAVKLKDFPDMESQIKQDLSGIQKHIIELNDKQKVLLQQLRKEIEDNINNGQFVPVFNFNLYKIKPGQLESKKRRRKDLSLAPKIMTCRPTHSPPSLSPSPTPSSTSSMSDDSFEYISPFMLPVPVPRAMLLPDVKENVYLGSVSRRDLRPPRIKRNQKPLSDEEVFKDIPVYYDPLPSPPPTDEKDLKARFMTALSLIPKEMLHEILNRKVERKRRSTATNNPNFVYNNDWEIPAWKRSRTYLSPHKLGKIESANSNKKIKVEDGVDGPVSSGKQGKKEKDSDSDKSGKITLEDIKLPPGLTVEKIEAKSRNSTPDSTSSSMLCFVCQTSGPLNICKDCGICYHLSCISPNSNISCPCCKQKRSPGDASSEESSKEEFVSKCPNVAESYSKLKEYIENHTDSDNASFYTERENLKTELMAKNHDLYTQKRELEEKAAELSETLLMQEDAKNNLLQEQAKILAKIKVIVDFVVLYQKTNPKKVEEPKSVEKTENIEEKDEVKASEDEVSNAESAIGTEKEELKENEEEVKEEKDLEEEEKEDLEGDEKDDLEEEKADLGGDVKEELEEEEKECLEEEGKEEKKEDLPENCDSLASWKESNDNSQSNFYSPEQFSQESGANSPRTCDSFSQMSKESIGNDIANIQNVESPLSCKKSPEISLPNLDEEDPLASESVECSAGSEGIDYESSVD